ncbi:MAG TPA: J domain-containing protein [Planctomycetes bacterium]|nr:J domain-containing protein [Planctomycetota bacterium]
MPRSLRSGLRAPRTRAEALAVFQRLGTDASALEGKELRSAYRALAREHHPDLPQNADRRREATKDLAELNSAYEMLKNPGRGGFDPFEGMGGFDDYEEMFREQAHQQDGPRGFQMGGFARPHEAREAAMAQRHYARHGAPAHGAGMPFVVGGEHLPRHPTAECVLDDTQRADAGARRLGRGPQRTAIAHTPGYLVMLVPPDIVPAFMACQSGRATDEDWRIFGEWCAEQGLERLYLDVRAMNRRQMGGGRGPRGYLNQGRRAGTRTLDDIDTWKKKVSRPKILVRPPKGEEDIEDYWRFAGKVSFYSRGVSGEYRLVTMGTATSDLEGAEQVDGWWEGKRSSPEDFDIFELNDWLLQFRPGRGRWSTLRKGYADSGAREAANFDRMAPQRQKNLLKKAARLQRRGPRGYLNQEKKMSRGRRAAKPMTSVRRANLLRKLGYEKAPFQLTRMGTTYLHQPSRTKVTLPKGGKGDSMFQLLGGHYGFTSQYLFVGNMAPGAWSKLLEWQRSGLVDIPSFEHDTMMDAFMDNRWPGPSEIPEGWLDDLFVALVTAASS